MNAISSSSREAMVYTAEVVRGTIPYSVRRVCRPSTRFLTLAAVSIGDVEEVLEILADSVANPLLLQNDIDEQKIAVCASRWPTSLFPPCGPADA